MSRKVNATYTPDEVKAAFRVFEGNSPPGHVKLAALQRALATYGADKLTAEQAAELLNQVDVDANGLVRAFDCSSLPCTRLNRHSNLSCPLCATPSFATLSTSTV